MNKLRDIGNASAQPAKRINVDPPKRAWFRGATVNKRPSLSKITMPEDAVSEILRGAKPETPFITTETQITAFGSCFAANISD